MVIGFLVGVLMVSLSNEGYVATSASALQVIEANIMPTRQINIWDVTKNILRPLFKTLDNTIYANFTDNC